MTLGRKVENMALAAERYRWLKLAITGERSHRNDLKTLEINLG
jgi:hypothetical protein